jgi:hypothetical protein
MPEAATCWRGFGWEERSPKRPRGPDALVWVTDKERSLVHRIYAKQATVTDTFEAGPGAFALARAGDSMWISSFAGRDVRRFDR